VGISDLVVYRGDAFPAWRGNLLVAMLAARQLMRVVVAGDKVAEEEVLLDERYGRIRDVTVGPDGFVYVLTNERGESDEDWKGHSRVLRLRPAASGRPN
jgi:glucose/arabinose dehydrogenase